MKYLFIDRKHIQMIHNIRRVFHRPAKHPHPVLKPDLPWEDNQVRVDAPPLWNHEKNAWLMWYSGGATLLPLYAESKDGLNWEKPCLGRIEWKGSRKNNIVNERLAKSQEDDTPIPHSLFLRDDREPDAARRFKGLAWIREKDPAGKLTGSFLVPFISPNGMDWKPLAGAGRIPCEDTKELAFDSLKNRFVATVKGLHGCGVKKYGAAELGRIVYLSLSNDFSRWTEPELIFWGDEIDREMGAARIDEAVRDNDRRAPLTVRPEQFFTDVYCMPVFVYEDIYLALPVLFNQSGRYFSAAEHSNQDGILYPTLAASRDLYSWDRLDREPFIPLSPLSNRELFDYGMTFAAPPVKNGNELWFYYTGYRFTHIGPDMIEQAGLASSPNETRHAVFLARLRLDGFASLKAGAEPGILLTKPIKVTGPKLHINADAARGEIKVEIRDALTGRAIPGFSMGDYMDSRVLWSENGKRGALRIGPGARFEDDPEADDTVPIRENKTDIEAKWKTGKDLSELKGREVRVFFHLQSADLFSFWF
jgi:hypothetical protein